MRGAMRPDSAAHVVGACGSQSKVENTRTNHLGIRNATSQCAVDHKHSSRRFNHYYSGIFVVVSAEDRLAGSGERMDFPTTEELERFLGFDVHAQHPEFLTSFDKVIPPSDRTGSATFPELDGLASGNFFPGENFLSSIPGGQNVLVEANRGNSLQDFNSFICAHPLYPKLLTAHFECKMIGLDKLEKASLQAELSELLRIITESEQVHLVQSKKEFASVEHEIRKFIEDYCRSLESLRADLEGPYLKAKQACEMFDRELQSIRDNAKMFPNFKKAEIQGSAQEADFLPVDHDAKLRQQLKRRYNESLRSLRDEFSKRVKKGKLPESSSSVLKEWWNKHLIYPYPSEEEKITLERASNLSSTQVNNWFINMRKRHWHKLFPEGIPENERVAEASLRARGMLSKLYRP